MKGGRIVFAWVREAVTKLLFGSCAELNSNSTNPTWFREAELIQRRLPNAAEKHALEEWSFRSSSSGY